MLMPRPWCIRRMLQIRAAQSSCWLLVEDTIALHCQRTLLGSEERRAITGTLSKQRRGPWRCVRRAQVSSNTLADSRRWFERTYQLTEAREQTTHACDKDSPADCAANMYEDASGGMLGLQPVRWLVEAPHVQDHRRSSLLLLELRIDQTWKSLLQYRD